MDIKYLGIDFGSSSVSVVGYENYNTDPIIFYDPNSVSKTTKFTTAMAKKSDGSYLFFDKAVEQNNLHLIDSLKEHLAVGDDQDQTTRLFISKLLEALPLNKSSSGEYNFSKLERICFGYPTYTDTVMQDNYKKKLSDIILQSCNENGINISAEQIVCIPEPILAAMAFNEVNKSSDKYKNTINHGDLILVVDLGGYTLDMTIVQATKNEKGDIRLSDIALPKSITEDSNNRNIKLGKRITKDICIQIYKDCENLHEFDHNVEEQKCIYFKDPNNDTTPTNLQYEEPLENSPQTKISKFVLQKDQTRDSIIGDTVCVGMYSSDDDRSINIGDSFNLCAEYVASYIYINTLNNKKISHVLFTGGTSEIKALRTAITTKLNPYFENPNGTKELLLETKYENAVKIKKANETIASESLSFKNIVALGAALVAAKDPDDRPGPSYMS